MNIKAPKPVDDDDLLVTMACVPDCCSESWIESIDHPENLVGAKVLEMEQVAGPEVDGTRQEYDKIYFLKLKTTKGHVTIDYRNSSNGYYGTWLEWEIEKLGE